MRKELKRKKNMIYLCRFLGSLSPLVLGSLRGSWGTGADRIKSLS